MKKLLVSTLVLAIPNFAWAEEKFEDVLARAQTLKNEGKFAQAITELGWAKKSLEKLNSGKLESFFPGSLSNITPGKFESGSALGFTNLERDYKTAEGGSIKVSLTGSSGGNDGAAQGFGALAGFAQMAAMMDNSGDTETVRINNKRATIQNERGRLKLMVPASSGMIVNVEQGNGNVTKEQIVALAEAFNYKDLEAYMGGN